MIQSTIDPRSIADAQSRFAPGNELNRCYDNLWQRVRQAKLFDATGRGVLGLTSCLPGSGVSTIAANMAIRAARTLGCSVLLVDADFRNHTIAPMFRLSQTPGLLQAVGEEMSPYDCVQSTSVPNLSVIAAGTRSDPGEIMLETARLSDVIEQLQRDFELIVFDLPLADETTHCFATTSVLDGILLVVETRRVHRELAARTKRKLVGSAANILGVVINREG